MTPDYFDPIAMHAVFVIDPQNGGDDATVHFPCSYKSRDGVRTLRIDPRLFTREDHDNWAQLPTLLAPYMVD